MPKQKKRILFIQTQAENAGAQEISRLVGEGLARRGFEVHNLFFYRRTASFDQLPNTVFCASERPGRPLAFIKFIIALARNIRRVKPDAVLTFQHYGNLLGGVMTRVVTPAPVIANQVSAALTMSWLVRLADLVLGSIGIFDTITVNSREMERGIAHYPASYRKRVLHVAHGFDDKTTHVDRLTARQTFELPQQPVLLGTVARLHPLKQLDAAIRVLPLHHDWHLAFAGQGEDEMRLRQLAAALGVADRVHFVGEIAPERVSVFLASLDVFVFPSAAETFGLAAVEAAQAGVPVVANDLSVLREVLCANEKPAALLVDATDPAALSSAIDRVLNDTSLASELRVNARSLKSRYSLDQMIDDYEKILQQPAVPPDALGAAAPS
jgi:glycosyltransferase involved in cell wall biosynthesis